MQDYHEKMLIHFLIYAFDFFSSDDKIGIPSDSEWYAYFLRTDMKILICDDEEQYLKTLRAHIEEYMNHKHIQYSMVVSCDPTQILNEHLSYDLAFLDIQMPGIDGITLAKELRQRNPKLALFFITNFDEYQDDAMDLQAFRFFEKPFSVSRLHSGLDKAMEYIDGAYVDIFLSENGTHHRVIVDDILYVTRENRKTCIVTTERSYFATEKYDALCDKFPQLFFYSVHKSFFVNLHYVARYSYTELLLTDGSRIPIAPRRQSAFHKFWFEYLRRR